MTTKSMRDATVSGCLAVMLSACGPAEAPRLPEAPATPTVEAPTTAEVGAEERALADANAAADQLGSTLRSRLLGAMGESGPVGAVTVCADEAAAMTREVGERTHATVGRASLRMRGGASAPEWVMAWLRERGEGPAAGAEGFARIEDGHARVLRPIAIEAPCLHCHGESVSPEVGAILAARYPGDRATGYRLGDLRGALYAEVALP